MTKEMFFSIPGTTQIAEDNGSKYWLFHIHVNGVLHSKVRYRHLAEFHEKLKGEFGDHVPSKLFPGKKLFGLTPDQLEERRNLLENYIQIISQDGAIFSSGIFKNFLLASQKATRKAKIEEVDLDIYLMNGNKFAINVLSTDETEEVLEIAMQKIGLSPHLFHYFALCLMKCGKEDQQVGEVVRILQDFESPYLSLKATKESHKIAIRKSYWSLKYDDDIMNDRIALNLLFVQVVNDMDRGWISMNEEEKKRLITLKEAGSKKEFLRMAQGLKFYGFFQFKTCNCDYPKEDSKALFAMGERELNMRVVTDENTIKEGKFAVPKIRCWRLSTKENELDSVVQPQLQFSFEYLFSKEEIKWIDVQSDQGIMMSMCLQGIVDEIVREREGRPMKMRKSRRRSDASSTSSHSSKSSPKPASPAPATSELHDFVSPDAFAVAAPKSITAKVQELLGKKFTPSNEVFEDIGDDDL